LSDQTGKLHQYLSYGEIAIANTEPVRLFAELGHVCFAESESGDLPWVAASQSGNPQSRVLRNLALARKALARILPNSVQGSRAHEGRNLRDP